MVHPGLRDRKALPRLFNLFARDPRNRTGKSVEDYISTTMRGLPGLVEKRGSPATGGERLRNQAAVNESDFTSPRAVDSFDVVLCLIYRQIKARHDRKHDRPR